jgi:hypothetical protein
MSDLESRLDRKIGEIDLLSIIERCIEMTMSSEA